MYPQQQKLSRKRAITQPKFGEWLPISNLTCILQYKLLQFGATKNPNMYQYDKWAFFPLIYSKKSMLRIFVRIASIQKISTTYYIF